jgi:hypothetical protein
MLGIFPEAPMSLALQIVLCLAVTVLTVFLVLLLIQARRTAKAVEQLAESASHDLHQVSGDLHEIRARVEGVTGSVMNILETPSVLSQVVTGVIRGIPAFFHKREDSGDIFATLVTGAETALHLFRNLKANSPKEDTDE